MDTRERERRIFETARSWLGAIAPEATGPSEIVLGINSVFYYGFYAPWVDLVVQTRQMLLQRTEPFANYEEGWLWESKIYVYSDSAIVKAIGPDSSGWVALSPERDPEKVNTTKQSIEYDEKSGEYYIKIPLRRMDAIIEALDPDLWARSFEPDDGRPFMDRRLNLTRQQEEEIFSEKKARVNQIIKFVDETKRMARDYGLDFEAVLNCVLFGKVPTLGGYGGAWRINPRNNRINEHLSDPHYKPPQFSRRRGKPKGAMQHATRIRTWAVFFLSKDGYGELSKVQAVKAWDREFQKYALEADTLRYKRELERLIPTKPRRQTVEKRQAGEAKIMGPGRV